MEGVVSLEWVGSLETSLEVGVSLKWADFKGTDSTSITRSVIGNDEHYESKYAVLRTLYCR